MIRFLMTFAVLLLASLPVLAQEAPEPGSDPYTVGGVQIDMPVSSPQAARDEALSAAQRQAWTRLQEQLAVTNPGARLPALNDAQLNKAMQSFEVAGEKVSAKRYIGTYTVHFRPHSVQGVASGDMLMVAATDTGAAPAGGASVTVTYQFRMLPDWVETERRLKMIPAIQQRDLKAIGRAYVKLDLHYIGSMEELAALLRAQNIELQPLGATGEMQLVRRDAA